MKLLMTADAVGGVWHYAMELIRAIEPHGVEVVLATMGGNPDADQLRQARQLPNLLLCSADYKLEWMDSPWEDVAAAGEWLLELEARHQPDVIHLNGYSHGVLPWRAPLLIVAHSCVLSWWRAVKGADAPAARERYRSQIAAGLRGADLVIAPSGAMLDSLRHHYGSLPPARVIYNARDPAAFRPAPRSGSSWRRDDFGTKRRTFRRWMKSPRRCRGRFTLPATAVGPMAAPSSLTTPASSVVCPPGHFRSGWGGRRFSAHPARYEPFGLSVLEAGLSRCALVLGDIPSLREIWGDAAVFVPPADPHAIHVAVRSLIDDPMRRELFAMRALARARTYAPPAMARDYLAVYRQLLTHRVAQPSRQSEESCAL